MAGSIAINVENLTKNFGKFTAVDNISFSVKQGEMFAFLGPNGAGKTTTIRMLTTILKPTEGNILVEGFDATKEESEVRNSFGIVFQDPSLDSDLTAYENMDFHASLYHIDRKIRKQKISELLKFVDLFDRKDELVKKFSGGMKRRLEIARGLLHQPKILFLDEPTLGLDPQTRNKMWEYLKKINKETKMTVFFTTHYMEEAEKYADKIAIIDHGRIIMRGNLKEIEKRTKTKSLEEAFLKVTGKTIREEAASSMDMLRVVRRAWGR